MQLSLASFPREGVVVLCAASEEPLGDAGLCAAAEWWHRVTHAKVCLLIPNTWRESTAINRLHTIQLDSASEPVPIVEAPVRVHASALPGRPHPASVAEQILYRLIQKDPELTASLEFNQTVGVDLDQKFRIDILCRQRRVAIEVDGRDHRVATKHIADCERDFRLLTHGYVVLRLPDELVRADPELAMARIREVLRCRQ